MKIFFEKLKWKSNLETADAIAGLKIHNHIPEHITCTSCGSAMLIQKKLNRTSSFLWVCKCCLKRRPISYRIWPAKYKIPLVALLLVLRHYVEGRPADVTAQRTMVSAEVCQSIYNDLDENQESYVARMQAAFNDSTDILTSLGDARDNFRELGKLFPLHSIYRIILDVLSESYGQGTSLTGLGGSGPSKHNK